MGKTGGGVGTNQYKIRGTSQARRGEAGFGGESSVALAGPEAEDSTDLWGIFDEAEPETAEAATTVVEDADREPVRYSFIKEFEAAEEQFNADFEGIPNRFYNADLRGKHLGGAGREGIEALRSQLAEPGHRQSRYFDHRGLGGRLCHAVSSPDDNRVSDDQVAQLLSAMDHVTEVRPIEDQLLMNTLGKSATRGWLARLEHTDENGDRQERWLAVTDHPHSKLKTFRLPGGREPIGKFQQVTQTDIRSVVGAARIQRRTGVNLIDSAAMHPHFDVGTGDYPDDYPEGYSHAAYQQRVHDLAGQGLTSSDVHARRRQAQDAGLAEAQTSVIDALTSLEDAQLQGRNFLAQRKHLRDQEGTIATAFDDKKHPDKTRQKMMAETTLASANGGPFTKVEIDNDVDPEEYADFEAAYHEVASKLPPVPADRAPALRIRKLGKHKANGIYSAGRNTVAVDVRTSEAFIHEMGHYYDLTVKNNASLSEEFRDIQSSYSRSLKLEGAMAKKRGYYETPTEVLARGFEHYAHQRLGIHNRLVNPGKFDQPDHQPFSDPDLKDKTFRFFDKLFAEA